MQTHQIDVSKGRERVHDIRSELFAFPEVLEVLATSGPDALVVVCCGRPRPAAWLGTLRAVGYQVSPRRHATAGAADFDRTDGVPPPETCWPLLQRAASGHVAAHAWSYSSGDVLEHAPANPPPERRASCPR